MAVVGDVSVINVNGNEMTIKDATAREIVNEIVEAIGANNENIAERINDLHSRSFDYTLDITSNNDSELASVQDGVYKLHYVTVTGSGDNETRTLNNSAIMIQDGDNQYLYKDGQISSRTKTNSTWGSWITFEGGVTSVNGQTGAVTLNIPDAQIQADWNQTTTTAKDYIKNKPDIITISGESNKVKTINFGGGSNIDWDGGNDSHIKINSEVISLNTNTVFGGAYYNNKEIAVKDDIKVTSVNGMTGAVTITHPVTSTKQSKINYITGSPSPNGIAFGASTSQYIHFDTGDFNVRINSSSDGQLNGQLYFNNNEVAFKNDIKVSSVNGMTGNVTINVPVTSVDGKTGAVTINHPVTSVNGQTGAVSLSIPDAQIQADWNQTTTTAKDYIKNKPTIPTVPTTSTSVTANDTNPVSGGAVYAKFEDLIGSAPAALDTLGEIAAALNNDADLAGTLTNQISGKISKVSPTTAGNFAALNSDGTLSDSGHKHSDYLTSETQADWNEANTSSAAYINNKPTIPTVPTNISAFTNDSGYITASSIVQSDWNQTDTTANDYIKNKPNITVDGSYIEIYSPKSSSNSSYNPHIEFGIDDGIRFYDIFGLDNYSYITKSEIRLPNILINSNDLILYNTYLSSSDLSYISINRNNGFKYINTYLNPNVNFTVNNNGAYYNTKKLAIEDEIPTKTSDLTNDSGFITNAPVTSVNGQTGAVTLALGDTNVIETVKVNNTALTPVSKAVNITVPTKTSDLTNDNGFITVETKANWTETNTSSAAYIQNKPNIVTGDGSTYIGMGVYSQTATKLFIGSEDSTKPTLLSSYTYVGLFSSGTKIATLNDIPTPPTKTSDLTNDSGFITSAPVTSVNNQTGAVTLALGDANVIETVKVNNAALTPVSKAVNITVPTKVSDLTNDSGFITSAPVTSVNGQTGAVTVKANVQSDWNATSGDAVILNKPTIPTVNNSTVTITMNGNTVGTFTLNKSGNTTIDLGTVLTSHQSIKTINNQTITGTGNVDISGLPTVTSADNGKVLMVVNGAWQLVSPVTLYSGSGTPANAQGNNGDLYVQS